MTDIVLITVDSLRHDHVGCYGYERNTTPVIDDIAARGHRFVNSFSHAGSTRKSFPTILTSSYTTMYGGYERISEERTLISELLDDNGYTTGGFHSNLFLCADFGYQRGFDRFYDSKTDPSFLTRVRQSVKDNLSQDSVIYNLLQRIYNTTERSAGVEIGSSYVKADKITHLATDWVQDARNEDRFLWTHYMDVHHPYIPPEEYQLEFRDAPISDREAIRLRRKMLESPREVRDRERQKLIDLYDAEIRFTDEEIGRLVETVREYWGEDTVILITADHGEEFFEHGQYSHNTVHDEGIHVPLIIDDNGESDVHDEIVGLVDVSPTIADYADCEIPDNFYGASIRSLVENDNWEREYVIGEFGATDGIPDRFYYRNRKWKYIRYEDERDREELYDLRDDAAEKTNVVNENQQVLEEIKEKIEEHRQMVIDASGDVGDVEMDDVVQERLEKLGYKT